MHTPRRLNTASGLSSAGLIFVIILIVALGTTWFKVFQPYLFQQKIGLADHKFEFNKFSEAEDIYQELLPKASPEHKQLIVDRIAQLPLAKKYLVDIAPDNLSHVFGALDAQTAKMGLMYIRFKLQNLSKKPIPVRRSLFYLKSATGKSEVALDRPQNTEVGVWEGDLLPGETTEGGICVKYIITGNDILYLVYNNGDLYLNNKIMTSRIWAQTDRDEFEKPGWKGRKLRSRDKIEQRPEAPGKKKLKKPSKSVQKKARQLIQ